MNRFFLTTGDNNLEDVKFYILKKDVSITNNSKTKSIIDNENLSNEIKKCYETSNTFIGTTNISTKNITLADDFYHGVKDSSISSATFLEFADVVISRADYLNWFIHKYGFLSSKEHLNKICTNDGKSLDKLSFEKFSNKNFYSEPLSLWVLTQVRLRSLIRLWRFVKATKDNFSQNSYSFLLFDDTKKLKLFDIENNRYVETVLNKDLYSQIFDKNFRNELNFSLSPKIDVEKYLNTKGISENISSLKMNQKLFIFSGLFIEKQINNFFYNNDYAPKQLFNFNLGNELIDRKSYNYTQYNSLLQLIYFQLMDAIIKNKNFSRCMECQSWFEVIELGTKGKIYCGPNCRAKAYRRRKEIKQIVAFSDPNGKWSLQNIVIEFCEAIYAGNSDKFKKQEEQIKLKFKDKTVQRTIIGIRDNIFNNLIKWCTIKTLAEHLDIDQFLLSKLENTEIFYDSFHDDPEYVMTYIDWDKNHKWYTGP